LILFIALPDPQDKSAFELHAFPLVLLPRRCPRCGFDTIIGHGQRRKQAHDEHHDWIWVRRGLCRPCGETFTILPAWSPPYGRITNVPKANPHWFRHTFATDMLSGGVSLPALMQLMGHAKIQTTLEYVQISSQDVFQQYARAVAQQIRRFPAAQS